jgi:multicomponent Na+:H+ antiporter subunit E
MEKAGAPPPPSVWRALPARALALAAVWWILTGGDPASWKIGVPAVALALWTSVKLAPPVVRFSVTGALSFSGFFLLQSLKGGVQVALLALHPKLDLRPVELELPLHLAPGPGQVILAATLCLMPGTLATGMGNNRLRLHVLDVRMPAERELRDAERRIAHMLRERLR